jgi:hypothetical protein
VSLEFLVIGAQKAGTTTLWNLLRDHPQLWLPDAKEAPFFSHTEIYERGLASYLERLGVPEGDGVLCGTVTPHYMHGWRDAGTRTVAERVARLLPDVRLIALLRDPVARARSQHAMATARGYERRGVDRALRESLRPSAMTQGRLAPDATNSYVAQGEYGRILGDYLRHLPRSRLHLELSDSLACEPVEVVRRILSFLGVHDDYEPVAPFQRALVGGQEPRVSAADLTGLLRALDDARPSGSELAAVDAWKREHDLDELGSRELEQAMQRYLQASPERRYGERVGLEFVLRKVWNVIPSPPAPISEEVQTALRAHFAEDGCTLNAATGLSVPWNALG